LRARNIVRSLLDFARERDFKKEWTALRPLVAQAVGFIRREVPPDVTVSIDIPEAVRVFADKQRLQQVFLNLVKNAVEALNGSGRVSVSAHPATDSAADTETACGRADDAIEIVVADTGPGIAPDALPRIFDPFYTTKAVGKGIGLGLFVVHEIVEQHDGCISAENAPGGGAIFRVRLPAQATGPEGHPA
jgi:signal transduction histidine kinase